MKIIRVKEVVVPSGMDYAVSSYSGNGVYWVNGRLLMVVYNGSCMGSYCDPSVIEEMPGSTGGTGAGGPSEAFVLALIDKAAFLLNAEPARRIRRSDIERPRP